jgi:hypothetical protein
MKKPKKKIKSPFEIMLYCIKTYKGASEFTITDKIMDMLHEAGYFIETPGETVIDQLWWLVEQKRISLYFEHHKGAPISGDSFDAISVAANGDMIQIEFDPKPEYDMTPRKGSDAERMFNEMRSNGGEQ